MELLQNTCPFIKSYKKLPSDFTFSLVDIGCSGGIDPVFLELGKKLHALAVDASVDEIERLKINNNIGVDYIDGLLCLPENHPFEILRNGRPYIHNNPWNRLSAHKSIELRKKIPIQKHESKIQDNRWYDTQLSTNKIVLTDLLNLKGFKNIDCFKFMHLYIITNASRAVC
jgi:hypothetical protein